MIMIIIWTSLSTHLAFHLIPLESSNNDDDDEVDGREARSVVVSDSPAIEQVNGIERRSLAKSALFLQVLRSLTMPNAFITCLYL